ncbi:MAG: SOS response-associated peptidase [Thermoanaerobaculales bacterium]|jgi:putative SOS response-associated peptidase YedK|nr:SOS response-associated peptidase [Thermoanaerobaculales bacterium]
MCGRFALVVDAAVLAEVFELEPPPGLAPRYNIAPTQELLAVRAGTSRPREWSRLRWGLVPSWAKEPAIGARMINARSETAAEKPSFRSALAARRCLVPASGFFEWQKKGAAKQAHFIHFRDARVFAFAALWERWSGVSPPLESCTLLTTTPNELVAELHDRMPVILPPRHHEEWLRPGPLAPDRLTELLVPHPAAGMEAHPVSGYVNRPGNDGPECIARSATHD